MEANMQDFRNLNVWKNSHALTLGIYKATKPFPKQEMFGLTSQIQRAAVSIPANIAEGCGKATDADFARYVQIAMGRRVNWNTCSCLPTI